MNKKRWRWVISIVVVIAVIVGGKLYMDHKAEQDYMVKVVKSDEAKKIFEDGLKNLDSQAFTNKGKIKSYQIDYSSVKHNPMGGINLTLFVNNKKDLYVYYTIDKNSEGVLEDEGGGNSVKLETLLRGK